MSKPKPPVPLPRKQFSLPEDDKALKWSSPPQSPTRSSEPNPPVPRRQFSLPDKTEDDKPGGLGSSTPPPVLPKKFFIKKSPGGREENVRLEILKVWSKPPKEEDDDENEMDANSLSEWWKEMASCDRHFKELKLRGETETSIISMKVRYIYYAVKHYINLLSQRAGTLKEHIDELSCTADNLDKVSKGTKIAGITGGATSIAGGVAAAAGVILSPFTLGASLALTAVGVGVAAAGGVTGASAAIANKVSTTQDKKKIEKTLSNYEELMLDIQACLKFINKSMGQLTQDDLSSLGRSRKDSVRVVRELAAKGGASARAIEANSKASGLIKGFALGMDFFYTQGKHGQKLKKGLESKFAKKIRTLVEDLSNGLDELMQIKNLFSEHVSE